jgi:integrase
VYASGPTPTPGSPEALDALRAQHSHQAPFKLALGPDYGGQWREADLVFATRSGAPLQPRNVDRQFKLALERAGLPATIRLYDLRHGNATLVLKAGVSAKVAAEGLGHASTTLFNDTYAHMLVEMDDEAADKVGLAIRRPKVAERLSG